MNLNTIVEVKRPKSFDDIEWRDGHAFLGGGTWLFSEPQVATDTLVDLEQLGWPALTATPAGPGDRARPARSSSCTTSRARRNGAPSRCSTSASTAFLMSFKIWNAATVGGNICMSLPAGAMISLTAALEGVCTAVAAQRQAAPGSGRRLRHRHAHQRPAEGRAAALDPPARLGLVQALRHAPGVAHPPRPLGRADRRHRRRQGRGFPADDQRRDAAAGASAVQEDAVGGRTAAGDRRTLAAGRLVPATSTARRPTSATSPSTLPNRFARSCHEQLRGQWPSLFGRTEARPVPAHLPARPRSVRRQEGLRRGRLRRLHGVARRQAASIPAWCPPSAARAARSRPSRASRKNGELHPDPEGASTTRRPSSAATARPA